MHSSGGSNGSPLGWAALLVLSQAASFALLRAGRIVGYQHWAFDRLTTPSVAWIALAVLVLQAALVFRRRAELVRVARMIRARAAGPWIAVVLIIWVLVAAAASRDPARYGAELVFGTAVQLLAVANVALLIGAISPAGGERLERRVLGDDAFGAGWWVARVAIAVVFVTALLAIVVYDRVPHVPDEVVYLLQARYFAIGRVDLPAPPVPGAFDVDLMFYGDGRWFSAVPPGWPAILSLGVRAGVPWLVNPLLSGAAVVLLHALVRRLDGERTARLSVLLLACSPWFLFLGMSFMTHIASLVGALVGALGIAQARRTATAWPAIIAGVATGVVSLIRPLEGLIVAVILGIWSLSARSRWWRLLPSAALTAATIATGSLVRWYNASLTGDPAQFPIMMYVDKYYAAGANDLGFGAGRGMGWGGLDPWPGHGVRDAILNSLLNGSALQSDLFGWATGSLLAVIAVVLYRRTAPLDRVLLAIVVALAGVHALYWFSGGPDFGARYWFLAIIPLVLISARAPAALAGPDPLARHRLTAGVIALALMSAPPFLLWRGAEKYSHYRLMGREFREFAATGIPDNALVLVRGRRHPDYHMAAMENSLDLTEARPVFAWDRTRVLRAETIRAFASRPVLVVDGPSLTGGAVRIVAGPLPPGSLAPEVASSDELPDATGRNANIMQRRP